MDYAAALEHERKKSVDAAERAALAVEAEAKALEKAAMMEEIEQDQGMRLRMKNRSVAKERVEGIPPHHHHSMVNVESPTLTYVEKLKKEKVVEQEDNEQNIKKALAGEAGRQTVQALANFHGRLLSKSIVISTIHAILEKQAHLDTLQVRKLKPRVSLTQSARGFFVQKHGTIARDKRIAQFRHSVLKHKSASLRIRWFGTLVGWTDDRVLGMYTPFRGDAIHKFIDLLMEMFPIGRIKESLDHDPCLVNMNNLLRALGHLTEEEWADNYLEHRVQINAGSDTHNWAPATGGMFDKSYCETNSFKALLAQLHSMSIIQQEADLPGPPPKAKQQVKINFEYAMDLVLREWYRWKCPEGKVLHNVK
jgi:hypothetical protein